MYTSMKTAVKSTPIEPGLLNMFRIFSGAAMAYFAIIVVYNALETGQAIAPQQIQSYLNLITNLILFGYLSWTWLQQRLRGWYLPIALIAATVGPIFSNLVYLAEPLERDLTAILARSWLLLPILLVPLVLIAWQYRYRYVMAVILFSMMVELAVMYPVVGSIDFETVPVLGTVFVRAFAFGMVGYIVNTLVATQHAQRRELMRANVKLSEHANTLEQLTISRERNRLARDLHDTLAHTLSGLTVTLEAIRLKLPGEFTEIHEMLARALKNTRAGLVETRRALKDLRSKHLNDLGLRLAIRRLAQEAAERSGFELEVDLTEPLPEIGPDVERSLYRIAQEALENIVRHSNAGHVSVSLRWEGDRLCMEIRDDGSGFDPSQVEDFEKMGVQGMMERAEIVNSQFDVFSCPGEGTTVRCTVEVNGRQSREL
jgi:signal transduction histidine kinase